MGGAAARAAPRPPFIPACRPVWPRGLDTGRVAPLALLSQVSPWFQPSAARCLTKAGREDARTPARRQHLSQEPQRRTGTILLRPALPGASGLPLAFPWAVWRVSAGGDRETWNPAGAANRTPPVPSLSHTEMLPLTL